MLQSNLSKKLSNNTPTKKVYFFYTDWMGSSFIFKMFLENLQKKYSNSFEIIDVDIEKDPELASQFNIDQVPTTIFLQNNSIVDHFTGILPQHKLETRLLFFIEDGA